jgi:hypothetical protein
MIKATKEPTTEIVPRNEATNVTPIADPMIAMIERIVLDPNASIDKLTQMLALKERLEDRQREQEGRDQQRAYYQAMAKCQEALKVVTKNQKNDHTKSRYADLAALARQADPIIHKHGFTVSFQPAGISEKGDLRLKWTIAHSEGHVESDIAEIPMDAAGTKGVVNKTSTQAFGSTASYGRRYLKLMLFDIATGDDNDGNTPVQKSELITSEQQDELIALADELGVDKAKFCETFEIDSFAAISANKFELAKQKMRLKQRYANADR